MSKVNGDAKSPCKTALKENNNGFTNKEDVSWVVKPVCICKRNILMSMAAVRIVEMIRTKLA